MTEAKETFGRMREINSGGERERPNKGWKGKSKDRKRKRSMEKQQNNVDSGTKTKIK